MMQEGLTGCGEVDQASMIFGCYHGLTVVTRMRCQGRKGEGKGSSRIVKSAFFSARPLFEGIRNVKFDTLTRGPAGGHNLTQAAGARVAPSPKI